MGYAMMRFETSDGPLVLEFDFVPQEPTLAQREALVPHICETCEWKNLRNTLYCRTPELTPGEHCATWSIGLDAFCTARTEYYKALHKKHYG
mgnify:CR=1 FL=1